MDGTRTAEEHRPAGRRPQIVVTYPFGNIFKAFVPAAVALVVALGVAGPAAAKSTGSPPCWKTLINDWYDGRIDGTYAIHCYRDALKHLPADVNTYSSARDDIKQALEQRITQSHTATTTSGTTTTKGGGSGPAGGGTNGGGTSPSKGGGSTGGGSTSGGKTGGSTGGDKTAAGPIGQVFDVGKPSKADSVPVPLIVLGAVALLLMAAGAASFLARRLRTRKLQLASAATLPQQPPEQP